ncbi:MAG: BatA domain-containing protein [Fidelibacterota bacterium]|nr:MAG: BatA domain-containing protein [Candidatus Neomarinimicrobiota bacterium]
MSFLIPQALWALPAVALPLIIHLISRISTRTVSFSTLHFLREMKHESIRRLRWHQWLVVLLRTLLLLVLVLLLARPVVKGYFKGWIGDRASILSVIVVDDSFSLSGLPTQEGPRAGGDQWRTGTALESLFRVLAEQGNQGQVMILRSSDAKTIYEGSAANLPAIDDIADLIRPGYLADNLQAVIDSLSTLNLQDLARLYANRELYLISDFQTHQQQTLRLFRSDTSIWQDWHFFLVPVPVHESNTAVVAAEVETVIPLVGELMEVGVTVLNTGRKSQRKVPIQVVLNDVRSGQLVVDLNPGARKTVSFQVAPTEPGYQQGYGEVARDARPGDNRFYFHAYIPPRVSVLLIEPPDLEHSFTRLALASLASETPYINLQIISPTDPAWPTQELDMVILNQPRSVPRLMLRQLKEFLTNEGTLVIIPGTGDADQQALLSLKEELGLPVGTPAPQAYLAPLTLDPRTLRSSILQNVFQRELDADASPNLSRLYNLEPGGADKVVLRAQGARPVLVRSGYRNGHIFLFAFPFHLQWTDLPLKASFIPMWHHLLYWRTANSDLTDVRVGQTPALSVNPQQTTQPLRLTAPNGVSSLLIPDISTRSVMLRDLQSPGIYTLTAQRFRTDNQLTQVEMIKFRVNIPEQELTARVLDEPALRSLFDPDRTFVLATDGALDVGIQQARFGRELWRPFLYLLILLLILETIFAHVYHTPRQTGRSEQP